MTTSTIEITEINWKILVLLKLENYLLILKNSSSMTSGDHSIVGIRHLLHCNNLRTSEKSIEFVAITIGENEKINLLSALLKQTVKSLFGISSSRVLESDVELGTVFWPLVIDFFGLFLLLGIFLPNFDLVSRKEFRFFVFAEFPKLKNSLFTLQLKISLI